MLPFSEPQCTNNREKPSQAQQNKLLLLRLLSGTRGKESEPQARSAELWLTSVSFMQTVVMEGSVMPRLRDAGSS